MTRVLGVTGSHKVAVLLRNLADEIERRDLELQGHPVHVSDSLEAIVELADGGPAEVSKIDVRLEHPARTFWNLAELQQALAHPGD
ncbi:MAG: hypothetical protein ACLQRH_27600 [Acidimicrobiales bacterium]